MNQLFRSFFFMLLMICNIKTSIAQWIQTNVSGDVYALAVSGTNLFAGTWHGGVYLSINNGTSWAEADSGIPYTDVCALAVSGSNLFAGTQDRGVYLSTNNGTSWKAVNSGLTVGVVTSLAVSGTNLFAGTAAGLFRSTNNGANWAAVNTGLTNTTVLSLAVTSTNLLAGTIAGVFRSSNNGTSWSASNSGLSYYVSAFAVSGTNLFAGTPLAVFMSTNNGTSWTAVGLGYYSVDALVVSGTNLFAGASNGGVWRRPLSEMITAVRLPLGELPTQINLKQNYPNPFNPSTVIEYSLLQASYTTLRIFDITGVCIKTLLSSYQQVGAHQIPWDGRSEIRMPVPSGIYFYSLNANNGTLTKKMILLR